MSTNSGHYRVIIADEQADNLKYLKHLLEAHGLDVRVAFDAAQALQLCQKYHPDFLITHSALSDKSGLELCSQLRDVREFNDLKIILLSNQPDETEESIAFDLGVNAYLAWPIKPLAFIKRMNSMVRRRSVMPMGKIRIGDGYLVLEPSNTSLEFAGKSVHLPAKTFEVFMFLATNPEVVYSRDELLNSLWTKEEDINARTIDVHIRKIRERTGDQFIYTIKGVGYKFRLDN